MIKHLDLDKNQIIIIFAIIGLLTIFVTLIVFLGAKKEETVEYISPELTLYNGLTNGVTNSLTASDFLIEKPGLLEFDSEYYLIREQYEQWDWAQVQKYWVNIKRILIEIVSKENDRKMEDLIDSIP